MENNKFFYRNILKSNPHACDGGRKPFNCQTIQKLGIIITYRDREDHLKLLLHRLHKFLYLQNIWYRIFVIEQVGYFLLSNLFFNCAFD